MFKYGDRVRIISGLYKNFVGRCIDICYHPLQYKVAGVLNNEFLEAWVEPNTIKRVKAGV